MGRFQLTPPPTKNPFRSCQLIAAVARVMFSVADEIGGILPSLPTRNGTVSAVDPPLEPVIVAVSLLTRKPFSSATMRSGLRVGNPAPAPHRNAPVGVSNPSGLPRHSY